MKFAIERRNIFSLIASIVVMAVFALEGAPRFAYATGSRVIAQGRDANPVWKSIISLATVLCDTGRTWAGDKLHEASQTTADYIGWGTGVGTAGVTDTTLFTEDSGGSPAYARVSATRTQQTSSVTRDQIRWVGTLTSNGTKSISNAGNFEASSGGAPIIKGDFTPIALALNDSIQFTFTLTLS